MLKCQYNHLGFVRKINETIIPQYKKREEEIFNYIE